MKKIILTTIISTTALLGSLPTNATPSFTGLSTISAELTCSAGNHDSPMVAYSGGYTVASNGVIVDNKSLRDILSANTGWLASFNPPKPALTPSTRISSLNIPCTAAVAEIQRYIYALAALDTWIIANSPLAPIIPALHFTPTLTSKENGDVTYHWSIFAPGNV